MVLIQLFHIWLALEKNEIIIPGLPKYDKGCKPKTFGKDPWCWERLKAGGEGDDRGWDGWMASLTRWTWVWASSRSWWRTGKLGVLKSMGSQSQTQMSAALNGSLMIITENCSSGITFCLYSSARKAICPKDSKPLHNMTQSLLRKRSTVSWPWNYMGVKCHQLLHSYKFMYYYLCLKKEWITHSRAGSWNSWIESGLQLYFFSNSFNFYGHFKYMQKWKEYYNKHQGTQYPVLILSILSHSYFIHHKHINFCLKYYKTNPKHCIPLMNISFCCTVETLVPLILHAVLSNRTQIVPHPYLI